MLFNWFQVFIVLFRVRRIYSFTHAPVSKLRTTNVGHVGYWDVSTWRIIGTHEGKVQMFLFCWEGEPCVCDVGRRGYHEIQFSQKNLPQPTNLISVYRSWNKAQTAQQPVQGRVSFADAISIGCEQSKQSLINKKLNPYLSSFHLNVLVGMTHITGLRWNHT